MQLSSQLISEIANLGHVGLTEDEKTSYATQLSTILDFVEQLQQIDTQNVNSEPFIRPHTWRQDTVVNISPEQRQTLLNAFSEKTGNWLKVPAIFL